ncbi:hypothetical protein D3C85_1123230 [compost metagenome]
MLESTGHRIGLLRAPGVFKPSWRLRHVAAHDKDEHGGESQGNEDPAPSNQWQAEVGHDARGDEADRPEPFQNRHVSSATLGGNDLGDHRQADWKLHAHAEAEQHAERHQSVHVLGEAAHQAAHPPEDHAHLEHRLAAVPVRKQPGDRGAKEHAEETGTGQQACLRRRQAELGLDRAQDEGHDAEVHRIEEPGGRNDCEQAPLIVRHREALEACSNTCA